MADFLSNFYGGADQAIALASAIAVWAVFSLIGVVVAGRERITEADPFIGWGVVSLVVTVLGVAADTPFRWPAWAFVASAPLVAWVLRRQGRRLFPEGAHRVLLLGVPMLLIASAMSASQWDEFSHWLPSARFLFFSDGFPGADNSINGATYSAYPYGWSLVTYLASRLVGQFVEVAGAVTNVLILLTFGLVVARMVRWGTERDNGSGPGWAVCALGGLAATAFNPTFVQKVALTAYADVATAAAVGIGGVLGWRILGVIADHQPGARNLAFQFGLVMSVLVNFKQATFVLFVLLVFAVALAGIADGRVRGRWRDLVSLTPWMLVPPLILYAVWRYHVSTELAGAEFSLRPPTEWFVALIPEIVATMAVVLAKKSGYLVIMLIAVALGVRGLTRMRDPLDRFAALTGFMFLAYNAFLLLMYIAAFDRADALRAVSLWRYNLHLGLLGVVFIAYALAVAWRRYGTSRVASSRLGWLAIVLMLAAPVAFAEKLRFDRDAGYRHYRMVGTQSARLMEPSATFMVLDPVGTGESAMLVRYEVGRPDAMLGYISAFQAVDASALAETLRDMSPSHLVVFSMNPAVLEVLGGELDIDRSYLLAAGGGGWRVVDAWPHPGH